MKKITILWVCIFLGTILNAKNKPTPKTDSKDIEMTTTVVSCSDPVNIPDARFKAALLAISGIDTDDDGVICRSEAEAYNGTIDVYDENITDLTGIEAFVNLTELSCAKNNLTSLDVSANTALTALDCYENELTALDVSANTALTRLYCYSNQLTALDVSANTALTRLYCYSNQLTALDVSANTALTRMSCFGNQLTALDVSANTALTRLYCYNNQLTTLDLSANTALTYLYCYSNQLTALDVSANTALTQLRCYNNQLTRLNISANTALTRLYCHNNQLTSLNVANGNNTDLNTVEATGNSDLICIQHDAGFTPPGSWSKDSTASWSETPCPCNDFVTIPDANFKDLLLANSSINTDGDGEICWSEAEAYTGTINVSGTSTRVITDLTGIEAFVNLRYLYCAKNNLTSLDVSANTALINLYCYENELTALDVSANTALEYLYCYSNQLTGLDVSANTALKYLYCHSNQLTHLDVSTNTALRGLGCRSNQLTHLDVSANTNLTGLDCSNNQLTSLDVSANTNLDGLDCSDNQLTSLDVSANTNLDGLDCSNNQLTSLDVSANTDLIQLYCFSNQLKNLNIANGNNANLIYMSAGGNSDLRCIQHDSDFDPTTATNWSKDSTASWSDEPCPCNDIINIPDTIFKALLLANSSINTDDDGEICRSEAEAYTGGLYIWNKGITDLTGIEAFVNLTELWCNDNQLTSLDVSANTALVQLDCSNTQLTSLDVSANTALRGLYCSDNQLTALDVSTNTALRGLVCGSNQLTHLDVSANTNLTGLGCASNQLTSLDVSANTDLNILDCSNNQLASLNVANGNNGTIAPIDLYQVNATGNEYTCIQHDSNFDPTTAAWWTKADSASWSEDCSSYCLVPVALSASILDDTGTSVELSWAEEGTASTWNIEYGETGFSQGSGTTVVATSNPYTLNGLTAETAYSFYVQTDCGSSETSAWRGPVSFSTAIPMEGGMGINTQEPKSTLDIKGAVRAFNRNEEGALYECNADIEGTMGYDTTDKKMKVCTNIGGSYEWKTLNYNE